MRTLKDLFSRAPFVPLQTHMDRVSQCVDKLIVVLEDILDGNFENVQKHAEEMSELEHLADLTKHDILTHLPKALFMPVDRMKLIRTLGLQDKIADKAEDITVLLTFKNLEIPDSFKELFKTYMDKNIECFHKVQEVIRELDELIESAFGGPEVQKLKILADSVNFMEHESDQIQHKLLKELYKIEDTLSPGTFYQFCKMFEQLGDISDLSEDLADCVKEMIMAAK
ncbi:MAG: TIGR00153 family protein [Lentisphaeria bacterium]|nr:TIGR00153 family protein [Lentisphaeria bacterium]NQZ66963.1 TIGR00153 family protein [Lentisphaeria bacterium]